MTKLSEDLCRVGAVLTRIRPSARTRVADSDLELKRESCVKTFKVVLLIDRVETEVMFIEGVLTTVGGLSDGSLTRFD